MILIVVFVVYCMLDEQFNHLFGRNNFSSDAEEKWREQLWLSSTLNARTLMI